MHYTHRYSHGHTRISVFCPFWSESLYSPTTNTSLCTSSWIHFLTSGSSEKEMDCAAHSKLRSTAISSSNCRLSFIVTTKNWHVLFVVIPFPDVLIFSSRLWIWNRTPTVMAKGKARYVVANYIGPGTMALPSYARHTSAAYCTHHVCDGVDGWLYISTGQKPLPESSLPTMRMVIKEVCCVCGIVVPSSQIMQLHWLQSSLCVAHKILASITKLLPYS